MQLHSPLTIYRYVLPLPCTALQSCLMSLVLTLSHLLATGLRFASASRHLRGAHHRNHRGRYLVRRVRIHQHHRTPLLLPFPSCGGGCPHNADRETNRIEDSPACGLSGCVMQCCIDVLCCDICGAIRLFLLCARFDGLFACLVCASSHMHWRGWSVGYGIVRPKLLRAEWIAIVLVTVMYFSIGKIPSLQISMYCNKTVYMYTCCV
jgi:hypothetical protein